ncbi:MAG: ATP cone domain-containing protein [Patescibacteria group bacterium]
MAKFFIKRGGKKVPFKAEKIKKSVRAALKEAHVPSASAKKMLAKVTGPVLRFARKRKSVKAAVIRMKVLAGLRKAEPKAAKVWLRYEKRHRRKR